MPEIEFNTKGAEKVEAAQEKLNKKNKELQNNYKLTAKEAMSLGKIEEQILKQTETARERYIRKLAESKKALAGNKDEVNLLARYEQSLAAQYIKTANEGEKAALKRKVATGQATAEEKKLHAAVLETEIASKGIGTSLTTTFSPAKIAGYAAGFVGIQQAMGLVTAELKAQQAMIDKRNAAQLTVGESRNVLLRNLVGSSPEEIAKVQGAATSIANETGVSEGPINQALAAAISATGGKNDLAVNLVRQSAKFLKDKPADIGDFAGSLGDLTRVTGSSDPNVSLGLLAKIGQLSRITSPKALAASAAPALIGATSFGGDARSGGALFASLTTGSGDFTGSTSGTALIKLAEQLQDASLGKGTFAQKFKPGEIAGGDLLTRIRSLQSNPALAQKFVDSASFEAKAVGPLTQLLTDPRSAVRADFENALRSIPSNTGLSRIGGEALDIFKFNELEGTANRSRSLSRLAEGMQTRNASGFLSTSDLEQLRTVAMETGSTDLGAKLTEFTGQIKGGGKVPTREAIDQLELRARQLETHMIVGPGGYSYPGSPEELESAKLLREAVDQLKRSVDKQQEQLNEQQNTNRKLDDISIGGGMAVGGS